MSQIMIEYVETSRRQAVITVPDHWDDERIRDAFECYRLGVADSEDDEEFASELEGSESEVDGGICSASEIAISWLTSA